MNERQEVIGDKIRGTKEKKFLSCTFLYFLVLFCTFFLGAFLRFYKLGQIPVSLDWDEASMGYNAWSLLKTGHDEYGNSWPLSIRSFNDYKPPVYTYLLIPSIKVFGKTEFAIRFPSALAGALTVLIIFFLTKELFPKKLAAGSWQLSVGEIAGLLLAISPWHIQFSRIAFEANLGLFFFVTAIWLLLKWLNGKNSISLIISAVSFAAAMMSYHSIRIVAPLFFLFALFIYRQRIIEKFKSNLFAIGLSTLLIFITFITIIYTIFFQGVGQSRLSETSFLTIDNLLIVSRQRIEQFGKNPIDRLINHRFLVYGRQFLRGYLDHYNLRFWFLDGDRIERHRTPDVGLLYWWEFPLFVIGLISAVGRRERLILFVWFLLAPVASAMTGGTPSAVRSLLFLPTFQIFEGVGAIWLIRQIWQSTSPSADEAGWRKQISRIVLVVCCSLLVIFEFSFYLHQYYVHGPIEQAKDWQYGYQQVVNKVMAEKNNYDQIYVTTAYDQPYIYFLWYGNYDPAEWTNNGMFNKGFDNLIFQKIEKEDLERKTKALIIGDSQEMKSVSADWEINYPDGSVIFKCHSLK